MRTLACVRICVYACACVCVFLSLSLTFSLSLSLSPSLSFYPCLLLSFFSFLSRVLPLVFSICISVPLYVCVSVRLCLRVSASMRLCIFVLMYDVIHQILSTNLTKRPEVLRQQ